MIPGDLLSAFPHRQFHTLPGLLDSWAALPNSNPNACMPMLGGSLYNFYDGLWYDRPRGELTTYRARGGHATDWANPTRSLSAQIRQIQSIWSLKFIWGSSIIYSWSQANSNGTSTMAVYHISRSYKHSISKLFFFKKNKDIPTEFWHLIRSVVSMDAFYCLFSTLLCFEVHRYECTQCFGLLCYLSSQGCGSFSRSLVLASKRRN